MCLDCIVLSIIMYRTPADEHSTVCETLHVHSVE